MASNAAIEGASGAMGGIIALLATYPLMTVLIATALTALTCRADPMDEADCHTSSRLIQFAVPCQLCTSSAN